MIKKNEHGLETWRYQGRILERNEAAIVIEAYFNYTRAVDLHGLQIDIGDRMIETFYSDRWYNIFEIRSKEDDQLKGWYCNIGMPAEVDQATISYRDLALDLVVLPDGRQYILDEDEFAELALTPKQRVQARTALTELQSYFKNLIGAT
ncbi:MAG: DUF402 domain-containing protein [Anaerolineales bacterium]|nr:DUF402 domain-containing protein [Anaerolineales bacterium]